MSTAGLATKGRNTKFEALCAHHFFHRGLCQPFPAPGRVGFLFNRFLILATHKQNTAGTMVPPPTTPPIKPTATHKQEAPGAMAPPPATQPSEFTTMQNQETPGAVAPMSTNSATNRASTRETEALSAVTFDTTIARADHHVMASQAIPKDLAFLNTIAATPTGSPALQHVPTLDASGEELEEGEIPESEDEVHCDGSNPNEHRNSMNTTVNTSDKCFQFAATPGNHIKAERLKLQYTATNQNITSSRSSNESKPFVSLIDLGVRHLSNDTLEVRYVALVPQLELLGNDGIRGRPDTVLAGGTWFIKKFRPTLITAFVGQTHKGRSHDYFQRHEVKSVAQQVHRERLFR